MPAVPLEKRVSVSESALVVVDLQNDFCDSNGAWSKVAVDPEFSKRLDSLRALIKEAHTKRVPVLFLRTVFNDWTISPAIREWWERIGVGPFCREGSWGAEFFQLAPQAEDRVINKYRASGFIETDFDLTLRAKKINTLFFTGVGVWGGLFETARDALAKNHLVVLVEDCIGGGLPQERSMLLDLCRRYAHEVVDSPRVMQLW